jgi:hypothetical protein
MRAERSSSSPRRSAPFVAHALSASIPTAHAVAILIVPIASSPVESMLPGEGRCQIRTYMVERTPL